MPLDLSEIAADADLGQAFSIIRSTGQFVLGQGFEQATTATIQTWGVEMPPGPKELDQVPEGDRAKGVLWIITVTPMYTTDAQRSGISDYVQWHGDLYRVQSVEPWQDDGFYSAILVRTTGA